MLLSNRLRFLLAAAAMFIALPSLAQLQAVGRFIASQPDPGWSFTGSPALTAPGVDPEGRGWLRLTGDAPGAVGNAIHTRSGFSGARGLRIAFTYASWGGGTPGADGISVYLFDAKANMAGAALGGGLGYCKGAGAWLGLALDEYGNFSHPQDGCAGGGGPGQTPQALVLRGPTSSNNPFITHTAVPGGVDKPLAQVRPTPGQVVLSMLPKPVGVGFVVTVDWRADPVGPWIRLLNQVDFPYAAPTVMSVGVSGSTGGAKNIHEIRELSVLANMPPTVNQSFEPAGIRVGTKSTLILRLGSTANAASTLIEPLNVVLPAGLKVADPPRLGGTCTGAVHSAAGSSSLLVERGSGIRAIGCTITVDVHASTSGNLDSVVPAGSVVTDQGTNLTPSSATLRVAPAAR